MHFNSIMGDFIMDQLVHTVQIAEGYTKWLFDIITHKTKKLAKKRMSICNECEHQHHGICELCGCILKAKTRVDFLLDDEGISIDGCPIRKW